MIDTEFLQKLVFSKGYKQKYLARFMNICVSSLRNKLDGKSDFKLSGAQRLSYLLNMTPEETARCFWPTGEKENHHDV